MFEKIEVHIVLPVTPQSGFYWLDREARIRQLNRISADFQSAAQTIIAPLAAAVAIAV
jgi:hypothetical protein